MARWLAREFDWTTGKYTGNYYDIAQPGVVSVFVCSYTGNDTNAGTAAAPFKTLSKGVTTLNSTGANGSRIFMNGIFSENLPSQTYWYEFIGCGGGRNGRTIFYKTTSLIQVSRLLTKFHNVELLNYDNDFFQVSNFGHASAQNSATHRFYTVNCFFKYSIVLRAYGQSLYAFNSIFYSCGFYGHNTTGWGSTMYGNQNSLLYCEPYNPFNYSNASFSMRGTNMHIFPDFLTGATGVKGGSNNIYGVDGLYQSIEDFDFRLQVTSPLLFAGSTDDQTGIKNHVGAQGMGFSFNSISRFLTTTGGAVLANLQSDGTKLVRTDPSQPASLVTGYMDFGSPYPVTDVSILNNFDFDVLGVSKGVFESLAGTPRPALTILLKYGNTTEEVDSCPWLEMEYGKRPTYSGTGAGRKGNGDNDFNPAAEFQITARFLRLTISLKNR